MKFNFRKQVLFTGAGFTKNFGGFLGNDMWQEIFNEMAGFLKIRKILLERRPNYESVYSFVLRKKPEDFEEREKEAFKNAIKLAYQKLDRIVCENYVGGYKRHNIFLPFLKRFVGSFAGSNSGERGIFLTLNQDLFFERFCGYKAPLLGQFSLKLHEKAADLQETDFERMPKDDELKRKIIKYDDEFFDTDGDFFLFKLHGSYGWLSSDGSDLMVLGEEKEGDIAKEPLLKWYNDMFKNVLFRDGVEMLIIGYSFNDPHINKIFLDAIKNHGLKFCLISPSPENQISKIQEDGLMDGLHKVFKYSLSDIFPHDQTRTAALKEILDTYPHIQERAKF
ncbi:MAG: SIR2 family protein [Candidatus Peregrinibacteria bacterium]